MQTSSARLSLAGNMEKPLMVLYGTEWRERGDEGSYNSPPLYHLFFIFMFNDDIYMCLPTCFLRAVCVCVYVKGGRGRATGCDYVQCGRWGGGGGDVNAVAGSLVQFAEFTAEQLKEFWK
jgi:hypothetical protein